MTDSPIKLEGLGKTYGDDLWAVHPCDGEMPWGPLGLLGPNGAGKTTFLSMLSLFLEPSAGDFTIFGMSSRN
ncbi:ATP-binding cassette domain-containing protein, partial [Acidobacteriota bacterium]